MDQQTFQDTLRAFIRLEPFVPFVVELENGEQIVVDEPAVAFGGAKAVYMTASSEWVEFTCGEVRNIRFSERQGGATDRGNQRALRCGMNQETFQETLRSCIRREPFVPFVVELENGERIVVEEPTVAFNGGFAGYFSPSYDIQEFRCEQVRAIRLLPQEAAS